MSKNERNKMPSRLAIAEYWNERIGEFGVFGIDQDELPEKECWACGKPHVQRCHIDDYAHGGANAVDNLVLLCPGCHAESESLSPASFWPWIKHTRKTKWQSSWSHVSDKLTAAGYTPEIIMGMLQAKGLETTMRVIGSDIFHVRDIDAALRKMQFAICDNELMQKK